MLFNSYEFLIFLPSVVFLFYAMEARRRPLLVLGASYFFYMWWRVEYAALLLASTLVDYCVARRMGQVRERRSRRKYLFLSLGANLGLLFSFKYWGFFGRSIQDLAAIFSVEFTPPVLDVLLPIGISFYTFQTLSYTIEVYRGTIAPEPSPLRFATYVAFFPQLVAGPIERPERLLPQLSLTGRFDYGRVSDGLKLVAWGLFKKVVVADRLALVVDGVYLAPAAWNGVQLSIATICFAYQIYFDFSGYSDIAIGTGKMMGVELMTNFDRPYAARSVAEFWRRWHVSLSTWFRDYVYIPLGGRRVAAARWHVNVLVVFVLSGLWHGADWTFVTWGAIHGCYLVASHATSGLRGRARRFLASRCPPEGLAWIQRCLVFTLVCVAWIFFRASSMAEAIVVLTRLPTGWSDLFASPLGPLGLVMEMPHWEHVLTGAVLVLLVEGVSFAERKNQCRSLMTDRPTITRWIFYVSLVVAILNLGVSQEAPFIYFQF